MIGNLSEALKGIVSSIIFRGWTYPQSGLEDSRRQYLTVPFWFDLTSVDIPPILASAFSPLRSTENTDKMMKSNKVFLAKKWISLIYGLFESPHLKTYPEKFLALGDVIDDVIEPFEFFYWWTVFDRFTDWISKIFFVERNLRVKNCIYPAKNFGPPGSWPR